MAFEFHAQPAQPDTTALLVQRPAVLQRIKIDNQTRSCWSSWEFLEEHGRQKQWNLCSGQSSALLCNCKLWHICTYFQFLDSLLTSSDVMEVGLWHVFIVRKRNAHLHPICHTLLQLTLYLLDNVALQYFHRFVICIWREQVHVYHHGYREKSL